MTSVWLLSGLLVFVMMGHGAITYRQDLKHSSVNPMIRLNGSQDIDRARIELVVTEYVLERKKWPRKDFTIQHKGLNKENLAVVWVLHAADSNSARGTSQSIELHVDVSDYRVVRELGFQ